MRHNNQLQNIITAHKNITFTVKKLSHSILSSIAILPNLFIGSSWHSLLKEISPLTETLGMW